MEDSEKYISAVRYICWLRNTSNSMGPAVIIKIGAQVYLPYVRVSQTVEYIAHPFLPPLWTPPSTIHHSITVGWKMPKPRTYVSCLYACGIQYSVPLYSPPTAPKIPQLPGTHSSTSDHITAPALLDGLCPNLGLGIKISFGTDYHPSHAHYA